MANTVTLTAQEVQVARFMILSGFIEAERQGLQAWQTLTTRREAEALMAKLLESTDD